MPFNSLARTIFGSCFTLLALLQCNSWALNLVDSTAWPQFGIDPAGRRQSDFVGPASAPAIKWKFTTSDIVYATPIIGRDSTVYAPSYDGKFYAISQNGDLAWSHNIGGQLRASAAITAAGDVLLLAGNGLYSFNQSGSLNFSNPGIGNSDPSVTVGSDGTYYASDAGTTRMLAFNADGSQKWSLQLGARMEGTPVVGPSGDLYFGASDETLRAVTSVGTAEWSFPIRGRNVKSATIGPDGTIYAGGQNGDFYAINPNGTQKWRFTQPDNIYTAAALSSDGSIIYAANDGIYSLNSMNGTLNWRYADVSYSHGSVFIDAQGNVFATRENRIVSLSGSGDLRWTVSLPPSEYIYSSITLDSRGVLYVGAQDGVFALAVPEPGALSSLVALIWTVARSRKPRQPPCASKRC
jgi:outer membrane protein assembly factor BamB